MEALQKLISLSLPSGMPLCTKELSDREYEQQRVDTYNSLQGKNSDNSPLFDVYDCPVCKNKFSIAFVNDSDEFALKSCECVKIRKSLRNIEKSGLTEDLQNKTFDNYIVESDWQNRCKSIALNYLENGGNAWLFAGGQSGSGKTHLCTAVCNELLKRGKSVRYLLWRELVRKLAANRFSKEDEKINYQKILDDINAYDVLYIDDFLKSAEPRKELDFAFEIINARYVSGKSAIISSELLINNIKNLDEALGSRIAQRSGGFKIQLNRQSDRNYRLKGDM